MINEKEFQRLMNLDSEKEEETGISNEEFQRLMSLGDIQDEEEQILDNSTLHLNSPKIIEEKKVDKNIGRYDFNAIKENAKNLNSGRNDSLLFLDEYRNKMSEIDKDSQELNELFVSLKNAEKDFDAENLTPESINEYRNLENNYNQKVNIFNEKLNTFNSIDIETEMLNLIPKANALTIDEGKKRQLRNLNDIVLGSLEEETGVINPSLVIERNILEKEQNKADWAAILKAIPVYGNNAMKNIALERWADTQYSLAQLENMNDSEFEKSLYVRANFGKENIPSIKDYRKKLIDKKRQELSDRKKTVKMWDKSLVKWKQDVNKQMGKSVDFGIKKMRTQNVGNIIATLGSQASNQAALIATSVGISSLANVALPGSGVLAGWKSMENLETGGAMIQYKELIDSLDLNRYEKNKAYQIMIEEARHHGAISGVVEYIGNYIPFAKIGGGKLSKVMGKLLIPKFVKVFSSFGIKVAGETLEEGIQSQSFNIFSERFKERLNEEIGLSPEQTKGIEKTKLHEDPMEVMGDVWKSMILTSGAGEFYSHRQSSKQEHTKENYITMKRLIKLAKRNYKKGDIAEYDIYVKNIDEIMDEFKFSDREKKNIRLSIIESDLESIEEETSDTPTPAEQVTPTESNELEIAPNIVAQEEIIETPESIQVEEETVVEEPEISIEDELHSDLTGISDIIKNGDIVEAIRLKEEFNKKVVDTDLEEVDVKALGDFSDKIDAKIEEAKSNMNNLEKIQLDQKMKKTEIKTKVREEYNKLIQINRDIYADDKSNQVVPNYQEKLDEYDRIVEENKDNFSEYQLKSIEKHRDEFLKDIEETKESIKQPSKVETLRDRIKSVYDKNYRAIYDTLKNAIGKKKADERIGITTNDEIIDSSIDQLEDGIKTSNVSKINKALGKLNTYLPAEPNDIKAGTLKENIITEAYSLAFKNITDEVLLTEVKNTLEKMEDLSIKIAMTKGGYFLGGSYDIDYVITEAFNRGLINKKGEFIKQPSNKEVVETDEVISLQEDKIEKPSNKKEEIKDESKKTSKNRNTEKKENTNLQEPTKSEKKEESENEVITDKADVQKKQVSIDEGELILRSGKLHNRKLSKEELLVVEKQVNKDRAKIGLEPTSVKLEKAKKKTISKKETKKKSEPKVEKNKSFKTDEGKFSVYDIEKDVRNRADMFTVKEDKNGWIVRNVLIPENLQRKGLATEFYKRMNAESIKKTGKPLRSTRPRKLSTGEIVHELSEDGIKLWDSFVTKGLATKESEKMYSFNTKETKKKVAKETKKVETKEDTFINSKVVDNKGKLLTVYRGETTSNEGNEHPRHSKNTSGGFFSSSKSYAENFGTTVNNYNLNMKNPIYLDGKQGAKWASRPNITDKMIAEYKEQGYDGIIYNNAYDSENDKAYTEYVIFDIKNKKKVNKKTEAKEDTNFETSSPEANRKRGFVTVNGHKIGRNNPITNKIEGKETKIKFTNKKKDMPKGTMTIVEIDDLQPSHTRQGNKNPKFFIPEAQPKGKNTDVDRSGTVISISGEITPSQLASSQIAYDGMPTVNQRGESIQGTGRISGLQEMYSLNGKSAKKYRNYLLRNASDFGMTKEQIAKFKNPVLVNMLDVNISEQIRLGQFTSQDLESGGTQEIEGSRIANIATNEQFDKIFNLIIRGKEDNGFRKNLRNNAGKVVGYLMKIGLINKAQFDSSFVKGQVATKAIDNLETIVIAKFLKGRSAKTFEYFHELPESVKHTILHLVGTIEQSSKDKSIKNEIIESILAFDSIGANESFDKWLEITDPIIGNPQDIYSPTALELVKMYKQINEKGGKKKLQNALIEYHKLTKDVDTEIEFMSIKGMTKSEGLKKVFGITEEITNEPRIEDIQRDTEIDEKKQEKVVNESRVGATSKQVKTVKGTERKEKGTGDSGVQVKENALKNKPVTKRTSVPAEEVFGHSSMSNYGYEDRKFFTNVELRNMFGNITNDLYTYKIGAIKQIEKLKHLAKLIKTTENVIVKKKTKTYTKILSDLVTAGKITKEQSKIMQKVIDVLKNEPTFDIDFSDKSFYNGLQNLITIDDTDAFAHEMGHYVFRNLLSFDEKIKYMETMINKFYDNSGKKLSDKVIRSYFKTKSGRIFRSNVADNFSEYFAEQFSQYVLSNELNTDEVLTLMQTLKKVFMKLIQKLMDSKYLDSDVISAFSKYLKENKYEQKEKSNGKKKTIKKETKTVTDRPKSTDTGTTRKTDNGGRPAIRTASEELLPKPKISSNVDSYELDDSQKLGVQLALNNFESGNKGFMLADGTGVGKTRQLLVIANEHQRRTGKPSLIVTQNATIIKNNFTKDAKALGIDLDTIETATYTDISGRKKGLQNYGVVLFDEAHNLKNIGTKKTIMANRIKTDNKLFATATPMDKLSSGIYFLSEITGKSESQIQKELGFKVVTEKINGIEFQQIMLDKDVTWEKLQNNLLTLRNNAIKMGAMIRRNYPFYGEISNDDSMILTSEQKAEMKTIEEHWEKQREQTLESLSRIRGNDERSEKIRKNILRKLKNIGRDKSSEISRWTEPQKVNHVFNKVMKDLKDGKQVIILAEGINPTLIKTLNKEYKGFINQIAEKFKKEGIDFAQVFGKADKSREVDDFNAGRKQLLIGTPKSGGTGIDLDDTVGDKPRTMYVVTANYSGDVFEQILGRVSRRNTKSPSNIHIVYSPSQSDENRKAILNKKLAVLRTIQEGGDIDKVAGTDLEGKDKKDPKYRKLSEAWSTPQQKISSDKTSISYPNPEKKAPKIFTLFKRGKINIGKKNADIGGGKYNTITDWLKTKGITNYIWDRFNRSERHNDKIKAKIENGQSDTATISNVLNVIQERKNRIAVIATAYDTLKDGGEAFFSMYKAPTKGIRGGKTKTYQVGENIDFYMNEIESVFGKGNVVRKNGIVIATKNDSKFRMEEKVDGRKVKLTPDRDIFFSNLPIIENIKTKEDIAEYNTKIGILNKLYENGNLREEFTDNLEDDWVLQSYGEMQTYEELYDENLENLEDEEIDYSKILDYLEESIIPTKMSIEDLAIQSKGLTEDLNEAGYVLEDGRLLDFSGKRSGGEYGVRWEDHREVNIPTKEYFESPTDLMWSFMNTTGAIRIDNNSGMIDIYNKPTKSQLKIIRKILTKNRQTFHVDLWDDGRSMNIDDFSVNMAMENIENFYDDKTMGEKSLFRTAFENADTILSKKDKQELIDLLKDWLGEDEIVSFVDKIFTKDGGLALGQYQNALIQLSHKQTKSDAKDTAMHEAVHWALDVLMRDENGKANTELQELEKFFPDEEVMAEGIVNYANGERTLPAKIKRIIRQFFRRVRAMFRMKNGVDKLHDFYDKLMAGQLKQSRENFTQSERKVARRNTDTKAFKKWFGDSKVVDKDGNPLVVYHGTPDASIQNEYGAPQYYKDKSGNYVNKTFNIFSKENLTKNTESLDAPLGFFFTDDHNFARRFTYRGESDTLTGNSSIARGISPHIYDVYLSIKNPIILKNIKINEAKRISEIIEGYNYKEIQKMSKTLDGIWELKYELSFYRDALMKKGYDGIISKAMFQGKGRNEYIVFNPTQIKSIYNRGTFDSNNPDIRYRMGWDDESTTKPKVTNKVVKKTETLEDYKAKTPTPKGKVAVDKIGIQETLESLKTEDILENIEKEFAKKKGYSVDEMYARAKELGDDHEILVDESLSTGKVISDERMVLLFKPIGEMKNRQEKLVNELAKLGDDPKRRKTLISTLSKIERNLTRYLRVLDMKSSSLGGALHSLQTLIDKEDLTFTNMQRHLLMIKGSKLSNEEKVEIAEITTKYKELQVNYKKVKKERDDAVNALAMESIKTEIALARTSPISGTLAKAKKQKLAKRISDKYARLKGLGHNVVYDFVGLTVEEIKLLSEIAVLEIQLGATKIDEIVKKINERVPDFTREQIIYSISNRSNKANREAKKIERSVLKDIRAIATAMVDLDNLEKEGKIITKDTFENKNKAEKSTELQNLLKQVEEKKAQVENINRLAEASYENNEDRIAGRDALSNIYKKIEEQKLVLENAIDGIFREKKAKKVLSGEMEKATNQLKLINQNISKLERENDKKKNVALNTQKKINAKIERLETKLNNVIDRIKNEDFVSKTKDTENSLMIETLKKRIAKKQKEFNKAKKEFEDKKGITETKKIDSLKKQKKSLEKRIANMDKLVEFDEQPIKTPEVLSLESDIKALNEIFATNKKIARIKKAIKTKDFSHLEAVPNKKLSEFNERVIDARIELENQRRIAYHYMNAKDNKGLWEWMKEDIGSLSRTMMASGDFMSLFRQGFKLVASNPKIMLDAIYRQFKTGFSEKQEVRSWAKIQENAYYKKAIHYGLRFYDINTLVFDEKPEFFRSNLLDTKNRVKGMGYGYIKEISERWFVSYINDIMMQRFEKFMQSNPDATDRMISDFSKQINVKAGRAVYENNKKDSTLRKIGKYMFAIDYEISKWQTYYYTAKNIIDNSGVKFDKSKNAEIGLAKNLYNHLFKGTRYEAVKDMLGYIVVSHMKALLYQVIFSSLLGSKEPEDDPSSADWGKIVMGNIHYNPYGYDLQLARLLVRGIRTGNFGNIKAKEKMALSDIFLRYFSYRISPNVSLVYSMWTKTSIVGHEISRWEVLMEHFTPMALNDIRQMIQDDSSNTLADMLSGVEAMTGGDVQVYKKKGKKKKRETIDDILKSARKKSKQNDWGKSTSAW